MKKIIVLGTISLFLFELLYFHSNHIVEDMKESTQSNQIYELVFQENEENRFVEDYENIIIEQNENSVIVLTDQKNLQEIQKKYHISIANR